MTIIAMNNDMIKLAATIKAIPWSSDFPSNEIVPTRAMGQSAGMNGPTERIIFPIRL
jgi:hypothetical protein